MHEIVIKLLQVLYDYLGQKLNTYFYTVYSSKLGCKDMYNHCHCSNTTNTLLLVTNSGVEILFGYKFLNLKYTQQTYLYLTLPICIQCMILCVNNGGCVATYYDCTSKNYFSSTALLTEECDKHSQNVATSDHTIASLLARF